MSPTGASSTTAAARSATSQTFVELLVEELRKSIEPLLGKRNFLAVLNGSRKRRLR